MHRVLQPEVLAQGPAFVLGAEAAAALQLGEDERDEIVESTGHGRRHDVEAVGPAFVEALLEFVRDGLRCADELPMAARTGDRLVELTDGEVFPPGEIDDQLLAALAA